MRRSTHDSTRPHLTLVHGKEPSPLEALDALAGHCIAARALMAKVGTPAMIGLIDLILYDVAAAIAADLGEDAPHEQSA